MNDEFNKTLQLNIDDLIKSIPVVCSHCKQIYEIKQRHVGEGVEAGAAYGICPECEKKQAEELSAPEEEEHPEELPLNRTVTVNVDDMLKSIPIVCAWCNKIYHIKAWQVDKGKPTAVSHGICRDCEKKQQAELAQLNRDKLKR